MTTKLEPGPGTPGRKPYQAPELVPVHLDPIGELLQSTPCNPQTGALPACTPPVCQA